MQRWSVKHWAVGGLGLALAACGNPSVPLAPQGSVATSQAYNQNLNEVEQARAQLPQRLLPSEMEALTSPPSAPGQASFGLLARTSNPHAGAPRGAGAMTATRSQVGRGGHQGSPRGGQQARHGGQQARHGGQQARHGGQQTSQGGQQARHGGQQASHGGRQTHYGSGSWNYTSGRGHTGHMGHRLHRDGWGRGYGGGYGNYWYYPSGDYLFPYSLGLDGSYYPYSGLDYPYFQWRDSRWWPSYVPESWNLGVADDNRTWVVIQGGRFQPEVVTVGVLSSVVFFNADPTPQTLLIQDASGGTQVIGPINPGQVSQVVTFPEPGQFRFSNSERSGMQGWVTVD